MDSIRDARTVGQFICPHVDGDFILMVKDLAMVSTGSCMIRQEGQGDTYDIIVNKEEAAKLAVILLQFAVS